MTDREEDNVEGANNQARVQLPKFSGTEKDGGNTAMIFTKKVDRYMTITKLSDEQTAEAVIFSLVPGSPAALWFNNKSESEPATVARWSVLKPAMIKRYCSPLSASEAGAMSESLKQGKDEDASDFFDRCHATHLLIERGTEVDTASAAYKAAFTKSVNALFLKGLRETGGLKAHVNGQSRGKSSDELVDLAMNFDVSHKPTKKFTVAAITTEEKDDTESNDGDSEEVAALKAKLKLLKRQGGQKQAGKGGAVNRVDGRVCYNCARPGHFIAACPETPGQFKGARANRNRKKSSAGKGGPGTSSSTKMNDAFVNVVQLLAQQMSKAPTPTDAEVNALSAMQQQNFF